MYLDRFILIPLDSPKKSIKAITNLKMVYLNTFDVFIAISYYNRPLTCVHSSQATPKPTQSERKKESQQQAHPDTSDPGADTSLRIRPLPRTTFCYLHGASTFLLSAASTLPSIESIPTWLCRTL
nr:hypothetical protein CFP56_25432 [Quercus suber]